ncbi:MAG: hypothetical protein AAGC80_27055 [Rhodococcus sp. (in: high G+C Gram-positive bacteria)]
MGATISGEAIVAPAAFPDTWIDGWLASAEADRELRTIGRWTSFTLVLRSGDEEVVVDIDGGRPHRRTDATTEAVDLEVIRLEGSPAAWDSMLVPCPAPRCNDVLALDRHHPEFSIAEGRTSLIRHLRILLLLLRIAAHTEGRVDAQH